MLVYESERDIQECVIKSRPSKTCKTPYVADISLNNETYLGHTPSLGCCGLADKEKNVLVEKMDGKGKCDYSIKFGINTEGEQTSYIGIHTKLAESVVDNCLKNNLIKRLNVKEYKREVKYLNSRFDFAGKNQNDEEFILEVKSVPLAKYTNKDQSFNEKTAYFPDGYRKKKGDVVSERALKHINELKDLKINKNIKTYMCYVVQRDDADSFTISDTDPIYKQAVKEAVESGVEIIVLKIKWTKDGKGYLINDDLKYI